MKLKVNLLVVLAAMLGMFACNNAKQETKSEMVLTGTITGVADGTKLELAHYTASGMQKDTAIIKEGKFEIKGDYPNPTLCYFAVAETNTFAQIYVENVPISIVADVKDFANMKVTGSKEHDTYVIYMKESNLIREKYKHIMAELYKPGVSKEKAEELMKKLEPQQKEIDALNEKFIKENPASAHAASLVVRELSGKNYKEAQKMVAAMDPQLQKNVTIVNTLADMAKKGEKDVSIDELMANVKNVSYQVDKKFNGEALTDIIYLGAFKNNNICALKKDGSIQVIDPNGKVLKNMKPEHNGQASSLAIDADNNIYLLCAIQEEVEKKVRGRKIKRMMPKSVECVVLDENGKEKAKYELKDVITATGARIIDNNLVIADYRDAKLAMFNKTTGEAGPVMNDMRPCCGILDFSVNAKKEILVANLGAFRVQGFNFSGESILTFGQRGKTLNDFHGCCNPVSVASLNSGAIVTVEKDPTRIKVYSSAGAKQIAGIEELVKGCSYIPMISDAKDNLYLASAEKGIVKCVSVN
ncbi:DUF4369 domain-containing protein [Marinifilum caeruleilacunae]|uniref:DUF4369 domain-containing protein n=1 Tax=Marinifilum caeruleilacunae TaxID=2499076 RepID=A0ABX1WT74_9BACT|nr:DUF4369 domain-containing protein [Marinifilum caeruleilacunae]NOU59304.1 DUF4369 domain-containing protein [Marinifilum caeruleilacunae]